MLHRKVLEVLICFIFLNHGVPWGCMICILSQFGGHCFVRSCAFCDDIPCGIEYCGPCSIRKISSSPSSLNFFILRNLGITNTCENRTPKSHVHIFPVNYYSEDHSWRNPD